MLSGVPMGKLWHVNAFAEVIPVIWPGGWDQPFIANELVHLGIALELVQVRTGLNVGRTMARGCLIEGTDQAIKREMTEVVQVISSDKGDVMRRRAEEVKELTLKDMESGTSFKEMMCLGDPVHA